MHFSVFRYNQEVVLSTSILYACIKRNKISELFLLLHRFTRKVGLDLILSPKTNLFDLDVCFWHFGIKAFFIRENICIRCIHLRFFNHKIVLKLILQVLLVFPTYQSLETIPIREDLKNANLLLIFLRFWIMTYATKQLYSHRSTLHWTTYK